MSPITIGVLAVSLSIDALVASIGKGAAKGARQHPGRGPGLGRVLRTGLIFGVVATLAPLLGWAIGASATAHLARIDHWIAFALLLAVGAHMIFQALSPEEDRPLRASGPWTTLLTALGTSVDAVAVGISLAFLDEKILAIAAAIGAATMVMASAGLVAGRLIGQRFGTIAEVSGGAVLIVMGVGIVFRHMFG